MSGSDEQQLGPAEAFVAELKHWRDVRGLSQATSAKQVGYDASYVSKVENGRQRPSDEFAHNADRVLRSGGALRRAFLSLESGEHAATQHRHPTPEALTSRQGAPNLLVEHDDAELVYDGSHYHPHQRRRLYNASRDPITRYLIRISVDRYPGDPRRSNQLYRQHPLTWEELDLHALHEGKHPMRWTVQHDRDAFKELWLLFENEDGRFPLYPGETTSIEYRYRVGHEKWGSWFQRAVRLPTRRLSVRLVFPSHLEPMVWGMETTMTADALPFRSAIERHQEGENDVFTWSTDDPPIHARFRLEWKFLNMPETSSEPSTPSEEMHALGVLQKDDPILRQVARPFDLPEEAEDARRVVAELASAIQRIETAHEFGKGMGIAAPQVGINRAAALVRTVDHETITLLNPRVIEEVAGDEQYEGCLSFFDVRGMVPRPLVLHVEHQDVDGRRRITAFERGVARLVAHEIDHLNGILYTDRMRPGVEPIPVSEYRDTGENWRY